jgi:hypothetical protein
MKDAKTIEDVFASIAEQTLADEMRRSIEKPTPWFLLLHYPSRAAWRSTEYILGNPHGNADDGVDDAAGEDDHTNSSNHHSSSSSRTSLLAQTQFNLLQHSQRTNKQLKRTYKRIMDTHKALAIERERERRLAANLTPAIGKRGRGGSRSAHHNSNIIEADGSIEDGRGRLVGDWVDKNKAMAATSAAAATPSTTLLSLCDDPSVALSLSMGLYSSTTTAYYSNTTTTAVHRGGDTAVYFGGKKINTNSNDDEGDVNATTIQMTKMNIKSAKSLHNLAKSKDMTSSSSSYNDVKPVGYGPEQVMTNVKYRLGPNYSIVKRILREVQSLLGGKGRGMNGESTATSSSSHSSSSLTDAFRPRRVLDFGSGVGSASAAALDVFGVSRRTSSSSPSSMNNNNDRDIGIDWVHSIDASQSMRESTEKVLKSILEGIPWEGEKQSYNHQDIQTEYDDPSDDDGIEESAKSGKDRRRLERRRKRMEQWEQTWTKRTDARTRYLRGNLPPLAISTWPIWAKRRNSDSIPYSRVRVLHFWEVCLPTSSPSSLASSWQRYWELYLFFGQS